MSGFPRPGTGGGGLTSFNGRTAPAATPQAGDYTAAMVTNAADKSSASTQAFTATITSNGNMGAQRLFSARAGATGAFIGRHDGGPPVSPVNYTGGDMALDFTTPGVWMTAAGGSPPTDWENLLATGVLASYPNSVYN